VSAIDAGGEFYGFVPRIPFAESFDGLLGLELIGGELAEGQRVRARVAVREELLTARGTVHGGVLAGIAEALASRGTALAAIPQGRMPQGLSNDTTSLGKVSRCTLRLAPSARGRTSGCGPWR
jgi:acyl-coenzyme A thioesterase PaaI-like protein